MNWFLALSLLPISLVNQSAAYAPVLTLDEAVQRAVSQAYSVRIAGTNIIKAQAQVDQVKGSVGPQVTFTGSGQRFDRKAAGQIDAGSLTLGANLNLDLAGSVRGAVRAGNLNVQAQRDLLNSEIAGVRADVRSAYFSVLQTNALLGVQREALANAEKRLAQGKSRFEVGIAPKFDVIRLEGEVAQAQAAVINAENAVRTTRNVLNNLLVQPIDTDFQTQAVPFVDDAELGADAYVGLAQTTRPELLAALRRVEALKEVSRIESRGLSPQLGVGVSATHNARGSVFSPKNQGVASIQASLPIWDSGITKARTRAARQDEEAARLQADQLRLAVSLQVRQAMIRLENARAQRTVTKTQVDTATEALRIANLRYENGEGILLDVTTAQQNLTGAKAAQVSADYELLTALAELRRAVGTDQIDPAKGLGEKNQ